MNNNDVYIRPDKKETTPPLKVQVSLLIPKSTQLDGRKYPKD